MQHDSRCDSSDRNKDSVSVTLKTVIQKSVPCHAFIFPPKLSGFFLIRLKNLPENIAPVPTLRGLLGREK